MTRWRHFGFSVHKNTFIAKDDPKGLENLIQYIARCPFSLGRLIKVTDAGQPILENHRLFGHGSSFDQFQRFHTFCLPYDHRSQFYPPFCLQVKLGNQNSCQSDFVTL